MPTICQALYYAFKWINLFNPLNKPMSLVVLLAPNDKGENETQSRKVTCPRSHVTVSGKIGLPHRQPNPRGCFLNHYHQLPL